MKIFLSTFIACLVALAAEAQSFEVIESNRTYKGHIGQRITAPVKIRNLSNRPIQIEVRRIAQVIGTSQVHYFCWNDECYDASTNELPISKRINPRETSSELVSVLEAGLVEGISSVSFLIYDRDNPNQAAEYEVNYIVEEDPGKNVIFNSSDIRINEVYPNPVREFAIFDYNLINEEIEAKIVLHNVLGSVVGDYELSYFETKLKVNTEDLNPGVYFYTLYLDNDGILTKKLIVRK